MKLNEIIERLALDVLTPVLDPAVDVTGAICSDLLSHVLAKASPGTLWVTIQCHTNVVAVAQVATLSAVLMTDGRRPNDETIRRAIDGGIALLASSESAFDVSGRLYHLLAA
jgi:hypothetical protein